MNRGSELHWLCCLVFVAAVGCASAPAPSAGGTDVEAQLKFGVEMARRGLWSEALFRFEQASRARPNDGELLNDLAVAYEAAGRFEDARLSYEAAMRSAPGSRQIRANQSRFLEFYQSYRPDLGKDAPAPAPTPEGGRR